MEKQTLSAEVRNTRGKGPARQLRLGGKIPAVLYGPGGEAQSLTVDAAELVKALTTPYRRNQLMELELTGGQKQLALVKDLDVHPVSRDVRHADFYRVDITREMVFEVPLHHFGKPKGVTRGGELRQHFRLLPVLCTPDKVPAEIKLNVEGLDLTESLLVKDVDLGEGVKLDLPPDRVLVMVTGEEKVAEPEDTVEDASKKGKGKK